MIRQTITILLIAISLSSCKSKRTQAHLEDLKLAQIRHVIEKSGLVRLPLVFDANNPLKNNYNVDKNGNDSLIFDSDIDGIIGFLPDTTGYFAFLLYTTGDIEYPTLLTLDKKGNKIDRQIICTAGCAGHASVDVSSCYDSVWIDMDLKIKSISKVTGTVETEQPKPQVLSICNMRELHGQIDKNGKIRVEESGVMNCDTPDHKGNLKTLELDFDFKVTAELIEEFVPVMNLYSNFKLERGNIIVYLDSSLTEYEFGDKLFPIILQTGNNSFELLFEVNDRPNKNYLKRLFVINNKLVEQDKLPTFEAKPIDINNDGTKEYAGYWSYAQTWGENYSLTAYNPILYYSITTTGLKLDSLLTRERNEMIYGQFFGFSFSEKYEQPISVSDKFEQELKRIRNER